MEDVPLGVRDAVGESDAVGDGDTELEMEGEVVGDNDAVGDGDIVNESLSESVGLLLLVGDTLCVEESERLSVGECVTVADGERDSVALVLVPSSVAVSDRDRPMRDGDVVVVTVSSAVVPVSTALTLWTAPMVAKSDGSLSCMYNSTYKLQTFGRSVMVVVKVL
jgi:hypothetical protein